MIAKFMRADGSTGTMEQPIINSEISDQNGGFTLVGFQDYEDKDNGKISHAVTGLLEFELDYGKTGFRN